MKRHRKRSIFLAEISDKIEFQLPGGDMGRTLVVIDKIKKTPKKYPRKAGTPAKMPIV